MSTMIYKSSRPEVFLGKYVLKISSKFTVKDPFLSVILTCWLRHGCSLANMLYIFRTPFPKNTSGWLLPELRPTEMQRSEKNVESVIEAFENLFNPLHVEDKEGICCISSGWCVTLDIQEDLLKEEIYVKETNV